MRQNDAQPTRVRVGLRTFEDGPVAPLAITCPECGASLVRRFDVMTRERFLGCDRYPACCYTRDVPPDVHLRDAGALMLPGLE